ncbi:MAG: hypothetical protein IPO73_00400 [Gemmatimonadetes bacterium]|nr:hypothetical protein [Gemmatimonadota bacterium]
MDQEVRGAITGLRQSCVAARGRDWLHGHPAGASFFLRVANTGAVHCWGEGDGGQLGDGTGLDANLPVLVVDP